MQLEHTKVLTEKGIITYGGNQSRFEEKISKTGCGMIAACDMILRFRDEKCIPLPIEEYKTFVLEMAEKHFYKYSRNPLGVPVYKVLKALNTEIKSRRFRFISRHRLNPERLACTIGKALSENIPVIVRIGANRKRLPYKIAFPTSGNVIREHKMTWHYITVTGIENDVLTFCSWGGKGEMSCAELCRFFGFTGGIIAAE